MFGCWNRQVNKFKEPMKLKLDFNKLAEYCKEENIVGVHVYTFDSKHDAAIRFLLQQSGFQRVLQQVLLMQLLQDTLNSQTNL